jgi:hypothetical protein
MNKTVASNVSSPPEIVCKAATERLGKELNVSEGGSADYEDYEEEALNQCLKRNADEVVPALIPRIKLSAAAHSEASDPQDDPSLDLEGYTILFHVGECVTPDSNHVPKSGGVGEFWLSSQPDCWKDALDDRQRIIKVAVPTSAIATHNDVPSMKALVEWGVKRGYLETKPVIKPDGTPVLELDDQTPLVRAFDTEVGKKLPFRGVLDPMRGNDGLKYLEYAFLKEKGFCALESLYSPDGHEVAVFELSRIRVISIGETLTRPLLPEVPLSPEVESEEARGVGL